MRVGLFDRFRRKRADPLPATLGFSFLDEAPAWTTEEYLKAFGQVATVYACVRMIAQTIAGANWRLYSTQDWVEIEAHEAKRLFENPNPFLTRSEMFMILAQHLELTGEAFWLLLKDRSGKIIGIVPVNPTLMVLELENNVPKQWKYIAGTEHIELAVDDVVHFKYPSPLNPYRGLPPLKAIASVVDTDRYAQEWNKNFFYNAATPRTAFIVPKPLSEPEFRRLKAMIDEHFRGLRNAHKAIILSGGIDVKPLQLSMKDIEFLNLRKFSREEIAMAFGVPLTKLGLTEHSNRAVAYVNDYTFAKNTIEPKLVLIREALNKYYLPHFGTDLYLDFDSVVPKDEEWEIKKYVELVKQGIMTINEVREELGYEPVEWGDKPFDPRMAMYLSGEAKVRKRKAALEWWEKFIEKTNPREMNFKGWISARFTRQMRRILEELGKKEYDPQWEKKLEELLSFLLSDEELEIWAREYEKIVPEYVKDMVEWYSGTWGLRALWLPGDPAVDEILKERAQRFAQQVNETTWKQLKEELKQGYYEGEGVDELKQRVEKVFTDAKRKRAETIARTELYSAVNMAFVMNMRKNGIRKKEWLTAGDERVRSEHAQADGQVVGIDEQFLVGGELLDYPGDPAGSAWNVINCRCTTLPVIE